MKLLRLALAAASAAALHGAAFAQDLKGDMEYFMSEYLRAWNAHDAKLIIKDFYRLDPSHRWATVEGLQAEFDRLKAEGYDHSDIKSITGCVLTADTGQVELRFTRLKTDGSFMPPKDRVSVYQVRRFDDGWRATGMAALPEGESMKCAG
jgi:hypothetical protein